MYTSLVSVSDFVITIDCDVFGCWKIGAKQKGNENVEARKGMKTLKF